MHVHLHASPGLLVQEGVGFLRNTLMQTGGGCGPSGWRPLDGRSHPISKGAQAGGLEHLWGEDDGGGAHAGGEGGGDGDVVGHRGLGWCQRWGYNRRRRQRRWGLGHRGHHVDWAL